MQISELMCKHAEREHGLHDNFEIMLESMMVAERASTSGHQVTATREMDTSSDIRMGKDANLNSGYQGPLRQLPSSDTGCAEEAGRRV